MAKTKETLICPICENKFIEADDPKQCYAAVDSETAKRQGIKEGIYILKNWRPMNALFGHYNETFIEDMILVNECDIDSNIEEYLRRDDEIVEVCENCANNQSE